MSLLTIIISITSFLFASLLGGIAYLLKRLIERNDANYDYIREIVDEFKVKIAVLLEDLKNQNINCDGTHLQIQHQFNEHKKAIQNHEQRIVNLEK